MTKPFRCPTRYTATVTQVYVTPLGDLHPLIRPVSFVNAEAAVVSQPASTVAQCAQVTRVAVIQVKSKGQVFIAILQAVFHPGKFCTPPPFSLLDYYVLVATHDLIPLKSAHNHHPTRNYIVVARLPVYQLDLTSEQVKLL